MRACRETTSELILCAEQTIAASDLAVNPSASIAISLIQEGKNACKMDVEDPTCWKITFTGKVVPVPADKVEYAKKALFSKYVLPLSFVAAVATGARANPYVILHRR